MNNIFNTIINLCEKTKRKNKNKIREKQFECIYLELQRKISEIKRDNKPISELINLYKDIEKEYFHLINVTTRSKFNLFLNANNRVNFNKLDDDISAYYNFLAFKIGYPCEDYAFINYCFANIFPFAVKFYSFGLILTFLINALNKYN